MKKLTKRIEGVISISSKGTGYVAVGEEKNKGKDPEIDFKHLKTALHGDTVEIILHPKGQGRQTAEVSKVITRAKMSFVGVLEQENGQFFLKPDDTKMYADILIPNESLNGAKAGEKVYGQIVSWEDAKKAPIGKILKVMGRPGDHETEMQSIAIEKGFDSDFPPLVESEAQKIKAHGIKEADLVGRRDFRKILTFTIDPDNAKDFDDAISFKDLGHGEYEVGIHIADVSHYVKIGSALDDEARERGTSVYLVDRTIPMLPEELSNDLCSLMPNKDRLTMSAVFTLDKEARVKTEWYGKSVIHSQKRFTYEEALESIKKSGSPLHKELAELNNLAKKLTKERFKKGAISLDQEEVKFVLDKNGVPLKVIKKEYSEANKLIEEFMLLANRKVAEFLTPKKNQNAKESGVVYRVHDKPAKEKMEDLAFFLRSLGHKITMHNGLIPPHEINSLLKNLEGKDSVKDTIHRAVIRAMAKAIYSTKNIGHYGLAFPYYTHFTSPIRRYPDVIVHRLLSDALAGRKIQPDKFHVFERMSRRASEQEKRAADAERSSIKYKQVEYMGHRIGKVFNGVVSGITEWGMYVEEVETKCEGLVRVRDMEDDFYVFNEKRLELYGQKKKKKYTLGSSVKVKVKAVDLEKKTIDYVLI